MSHGDNLDDLRRHPIDEAERVSREKSTARAFEMCGVSLGCFHHAPNHKVNLERKGLGGKLTSFGVPRLGLRNFLRRRWMKDELTTHGAAQGA